MAEIENAEKSDLEAPGFEEEYKRYSTKSKKRALDAERVEGIRRKVSYGHLHHM
jgi:DNA helicase INO80